MFLSALPCILKHRWKKSSGDNFPLLTITELTIISRNLKLIGQSLRLRHDHSRTRSTFTNGISTSIHNNLQNIRSRLHKPEYDGNHAIEPLSRANHHDRLVPPCQRPRPLLPNKQVPRRCSRLPPGGPPA